MANNTHGAPSVCQVLELRQGGGILVFTRNGWAKAAEYFESALGGQAGILTDLVVQVRAPLENEREMMKRYYLYDLGAWPISYHEQAFKAQLWEEAARFYKSGLDTVVNLYNGPDWSIEAFEGLNNLFKRLGYLVSDPHLESPHIRVENYVTSEVMDIALWVNARNFKLLYAQGEGKDRSHEITHAAFKDLQAKIDGNHAFFEEVVAQVTNPKRVRRVAMQAFYESPEVPVYEVVQYLEDLDGNRVRTTSKRYNCWTEFEACRRFTWDMRSEGWDKPLCAALKHLNLTAPVLEATRL